MPRLVEVAAEPLGAPTFAPFGTIVGAVGGTPVTSADVLPSIKRFTDTDVQGGLLARVTQSMTAIDDRTFSIVLEEPFGLVLKTLAKTASVPLFVMPKRSPSCRSASRSPTPTARARSSSSGMNGAHWCLRQVREIATPSSTWGDWSYLGRMENNT